MESNKTSWVPDPVTGYYRPETHAKEIDAAELRNMLLKYKPRQNWKKKKNKLEDQESRFDE